MSEKSPILNNPYEEPRWHYAADLEGNLDYNKVLDGRRPYTAAVGIAPNQQQNKLRPAHIKKIVYTYRERKEIEKYSHLATLQEVADNDYNLNIPRYVDTFEEEEPIDIHAVMREIKELESKRADLDKEIEGYLKELGLVE